MLNSKTFTSKHKLTEPKEDANDSAVQNPETSVEKDTKKKKQKNNQGKEKQRPQSLGLLNKKIERAQDDADEEVIVVKGKANPNSNAQAQSDKKKKKKNKNKSNGDAQDSQSQEKSKKDKSKTPKPKKSKTPQNEDDESEPPKPKKDKKEKQEKPPKQPKPAKQENKEQSQPKQPNQAGQNDKGQTEGNANPHQRRKGTKSQNRESKKIRQERGRAFVNSRFARIMQSGEKTYEICVSNLPKKVTEASLADFFSGCGEVKKTILEKDNTKAFVVFDDPESVLNALEINEIKWEGVFLKIEKSNASHRPQERVLTGESATTVFVGNINPITSEETLKKFFEPCGEIEQVRYHYTQDGKPRGFAHVKFKYPESVDRAIVKGMETLDERQLKVERSSKKAGPDSRINFTVFNHKVTRQNKVQPQAKVEPEVEKKEVNDQKKPYIPDPKVHTEKDIGTIAQFKGTKVKL